MSAPSVGYHCTGASSLVVRAFQMPARIKRPFQTIAIDLIGDLELS